VIVERLQIGGGDDLRPVRSLALRLHQLEHRVSMMDVQTTNIQRQLDAIHGLVETFCEGKP